MFSMKFYLPNTFRPWQLLWKITQIKKLTTLFFLMLMVGLTEGVGILLLVPLINAVNGLGEESFWLNALLLPLKNLGISPTLWVLMSIFISLVLMRSILQYCRDVVSVRYQYELVDHLRRNCFGGLMNVEWRWFSEKRQTDFSNILLTDINRVGTGLHFSLALAVSMVSISVYLIAAWILSWQMTLFAVASSILLLFSLSKQSNAALTVGRAMSEAGRSLHSSVQGSLENIKLIKILSNKEQYLHSFDRAVMEVRGQQIKFIKTSSLSKSLYQVGGILLLSIFLYFGLTYWKTPFSEILTLIFIFSRLMPLCISAQQQYHHCLHELPALEGINKLLGECELASEPPLESNLDWSVNNSIELKNVTVKYVGRKKAALSDISLAFQANTTTVVMGQSGSGKSTLADVLAGLLMPDHGGLFVDGVMVEGGERIKWRQSVAYVPQDVFLFHDSIRNNLLLGNHSATDYELTKAIRDAAAEFVFNLPHGLDTIIGDRGVQFSGGERQRIMLARALLRKPSLFILDEVTSSLDNESEARIYDGIKYLQGAHTIIIITHRMPDKINADQVITLKSGNALIHSKNSKII
ncbi:ABC transporter ATP-binding protein [Polynucleobacter sp. es-EL-1]|uniref:ABC transporter ATP-binding protein n=1 Tax=Polynucleobacter sp. es-EL-1 TaxID=1855652 RepID=UPI001BFDEB17|nr:ABC transporter ATP-binding protein [Polynucleobacter sp. es-EL-1]QWE11339.1 ABC transporter ATP-binding protein [Polynucleobacter sp. es-EL-1]